MRAGQACCYLFHTQKKTTPYSNARHFAQVGGSLFVTLIIVAVLIYFFYNHNTYDFDTPKGILHEEVRSPEGNYSARIYYEYYGGAAGGVNRK